MVLDSYATTPETVLVNEESEQNETALFPTISGAIFFVRIEDLLDPARETERLLKEKAKLEEEIKRAQEKLTNPEFLAKTPPEVIKQERAKLAEYQAMLAKVEQALAELVRQEVGQEKRL